MLKTIRVNGRQARQLADYLATEPDFGRRVRTLAVVLGRHDDVEPATLDALLALTPVVKSFAVVGGALLAAALSAARDGLDGPRELVVHADRGATASVEAVVAAGRATIATALHFGFNLRRLVLADIVDLEVPIGDDAFPVLESLVVTNVPSRLVAGIARAAPRLTSLDSAVVSAVSLDEKTAERLRTLRLNNPTQRSVGLSPEQVAHFRSMAALTLAAGIEIDRDVLRALPPSLVYVRRSLGACLTSQLSMAQTHCLKVRSRRCTMLTAQLVVECVKDGDWLPSLGELVCTRFAHEAASSLTTYDRLLLRIGCESRNIQLRIVPTSL